MNHFYKFYRLIPLKFKARPTAIAAFIHCLRTSRSSSLK